MLAQGLLKVCLLVCPFAVFRPNSHVVAKLNQHMTYTDILLLGYPQVMPAWSAQLWFYHFSATKMFIQRQTYTGSKRFKPNLETLWVRLGTLNRRSP